METKKVLVIDDEADFGLMLKHFFKTKNFSVYIAGTIADGLKLLHDERPDMIFLDNHLPDGYGWSQTSFITDNFPQSKLHLISAEEVPKTSASTFSIFYKPFIREELLKMFGN